MRHQKHRYRLGRPLAARKALLRNLSLALLTNERIVTTEPKAKALRRVVEPLITLGKKGDLAARRRALQILPNKKIIQKLFNELAPQYADRNGGYTRILKLSPRHGDAAPMAMIELVGFSEKQQAEEQQAAADETKKSKGIRQRLKDKVGKGAKKETAPLKEAAAKKAPAKAKKAAVSAEEIGAEIEQATAVDEVSPTEVEETTAEDSKADAGEEAPAEDKEEK